MKPHQHAPIRGQSIDRPFTVCVRPGTCVPGAHGNITRIDICRCGAQRAANINQNFYESTGWRREGVA